MSGAGAGQVLRCWKCGADVSDARLPDAREARCPDCEADLHVCRMCRHYAPRLSGACDEDRADEVSAKDRANFCDWFIPNAGAFIPKSGTAAQAAREGLNRLFGGAAADPKAADDGSASRRALEDLFKKP
jgi:hypothetical protein